MGVSVCGLHARHCLPELYGLLNFRILRLLN